MEIFSSKLARLGPCYLHARMVYVLNLANINLKHQPSFIALKLEESFMSVLHGVIKCLFSE